VTMAVKVMVLNFILWFWFLTFVFHNWDYFYTNAILVSTNKTTFFWQNSRSTLSLYI